MSKPELPPDPDCLNSRRATWAEASLTTFKALTQADDCDALADLLADLMHLCDRNGKDFASELRRAANHYDAETEGVGDQHKGIIL